MNVTSVIIDKELYEPQAIVRKGCSCQLIPTCKVFSTIEGDRQKSTHKYALMVLSHETRGAQIKNSLLLGKIHHQLEIDSITLKGSGSSNILLSKVSFDCMITDNIGKTCRDYISFDLKIPGVNNNSESVLSYDFLEKEYGGQKNLYEVLKYFYVLGKKTVNPTQHTHGHCPDYSREDGKHDQYIRHTEQLLVAYLALPKASEMLYNRLKVEIRSKYQDACTLKVYNMGLHMHSTKTCCAPCEYALIGLKNDYSGYGQNNKRYSFLYNFNQNCALPNELLIFKLPQKSLFKIIVTVTASQNDADHKKQPDYKIKNVELKDNPIPYKILVKDAQVLKKIYTAMLDNEYDKRKLSSASNLNDISIGISGSKISPGSPKTIEKVKETRGKDLSDITVKLSYFGL